MNSTLKIELDNTLITGRVDGIDNFVVTIRKQDEDGRIASSFSSELTFYDDGYQYLKTKLLDSQFGFSAEVDVKIYDDYCGEVVFDGKIRGDGVDWCEPNCYITANIIEDDPVYSCIQNKVIWDNQNGFLSKQLPGVTYCIMVRPLFVHEVISYMMALLQQIVAFVFLVLLPVVALVYVICELIRGICAVFGCNKPNCTGDFSNPREWLDLLSDILAKLSQCNHRHPSPYVRDYIKNVCDICGLTFRSSILNDPASQYNYYYNLVMMAAQVERGRDGSNMDNTLIQENAPTETLATLMDTYLKPLFNADYQIANGELVFERKDYFFNSNSIWIDTEQLLNDGLIVDNAVCYSWIDKERYSFGNYKYSMDASDYIGNEVRFRWEDIVEWNGPPTNSAQIGSKDLTVLSSPARFLKDGYNGADLLLAYFNRYDIESMIMSQHRAFNYKFLIVKPNDESYVASYYSNAFTGGSLTANEDERYNYPMWFREGYTNNLYSNFHYIDNPRLALATNYNFKFTFAFDCATYNSFDFNKTVKLVLGGNVKYGQVRELSVDFNKRTISVTGIV